jgi:hypothetical protein
MKITNFYRTTLLLSCLALMPRTIFPQVSVQQNGCSSLLAKIETSQSLNDGVLKSYTLEKLISEGVWTSVDKHHTRINTSEFINLPKGVYRVKLVSHRSNGPELLISNSVNMSDCLLSEKQISSELEVFVWPNPATDIVTVKIVSVFNAENPAYVSIFNSVGALIDEKIMLNDITTLSTNYLPSGIYYISVRNGSKIFAHKKFILNK